MSFDEVRFPTTIALSTVAGPGFKTEIVMTDSGFEQRNADWSSARWTGDLAKPIVDTDDLATVIAFFYARKGRHRGFRCKDYADFSVTGQTLIASATGSETTVQLLKTYTSGGQTYSRTIYKPVSGTVKLYDNGSLISSTPNTVTGVVTFSAITAGHTLTADFEFDVPVRFDVDELPILHVEPGIQRIDSLPVVELRLDSSGQG